MGRLVRAEVQKVCTTRVWLWLLLAALAISALVAVGSLASDGVESRIDVPDIFGSANGAAVAAFVLGILGVTTEFRYQTITPTFLVTPSRFLLITAKLICYALVGTGYAVLCLALQIAIAAPWLSAKHIDFSVTDRTVRRVLLAIVLIHALFAILGVGFGALLRNQVAALTVGLLILLVVVNVIVAIPGVKHAWAYTPSGAVTALVYTHGSRSANGVHVLGVAGGVLVLLVWALVPAAVGATVTLRRDIT